MKQPPTSTRSVSLQGLALEVDLRVVGMRQRRVLEGRTIVGDELGVIEHARDDNPAMALGDFLVTLFFRAAAFLLRFRPLRRRRLPASLPSSRLLARSSSAFCSAAMSAWLLPFLLLRLPAHHPPPPIIPPPAGRRLRRLRLACTYLGSSLPSSGMRFPSLSSSKTRSLPGRDKHRGRWPRSRSACRESSRRPARAMTHSRAAL